MEKMTLKQFLKAVNGNESSIIEYRGDEAMEAVKQDGDALQYVKEQTEAICMEAVKKNGDALRYVDKSCFAKEVRKMTVAEISKELGYDIQIIG